MVRDLGLVALHYKHKWAPTFVYGNHSNRIDFMFIRQHQVQWNKHGAQVLTRFERTMGCIAPFHHPLVLSLSKWFASSRNTPSINPIDRHRLRQEYWTQTENWHAFESQVLAKIQHVTSLIENSQPKDPISTCIKVEQTIRMLYQQHFPKVRLIYSTCPQVKPMAAQIWFARRQLLRLRTISMQAVFRGWKNIMTFDRIHKAIRKQSRQNRKDRLNTFLAESVPLILQHRLHDWYKRIRKLCPNQMFRKIQMFDMHGTLMSQSQDLPNTSRTYLLMHTRRSHILQELQHLPVTKALPPDGFPALIWRHFAHVLIPIFWTCIQQAWCDKINAPPPHWSAGWIHLLAKPNKTPNKPEALRPICLQYPMNKVLSDIHCRLILPITYASLRQLPLFAYMPNRGTKDYLLIVSVHCRRVRALYTELRRDDAKQGLWGGIQISLDMEKAFDIVSRTLVSRALHAFDLSSDLQSLVHSWFVPHAYFIPHEELIGKIQATGGIKQGSKDAPLFWNLTMYLILQDLLAQYDKI